MQVKVEDLLECSLPVREENVNAFTAQTRTPQSPAHPVADPPYVRARFLIKVFQPDGMDAPNHEKVTGSDSPYVHDYHYAIVCVRNTRLSLATKDRAEHAIRTSRISHAQHGDSERHPTANAFGLSKIRYVRGTHLPAIGPSRACRKPYHEQGIELISKKSARVAVPVACPVGQ